MTGGSKATCYNPAAFAHIEKFCSKSPSKRGARPLEGSAEDSTAIRENIQRKPISR